MSKRILFICSLITIISFIAGGIATVTALAYSSLAGKLAGRILLQVEEKGEAWYVDPVNLKRYYLGRAQDCFDIMREKGLGITNSNLSQIDIAQDSKIPGYTVGWKNYQSLISGQFSIDFKYPQNLAIDYEVPRSPTCTIEPHCTWNVSFTSASDPNYTPGFIPDLRVYESQVPLSYSEGVDYQYKTANSNNVLVTYKIISQDNGDDYIKLETIPDGKINGYYYKFSMLYHQGADAKYGVDGKQMFEEILASVRFK